MAKGDVVMKFDAQTAQFIASVMKAREAMEAGANTARKFGKDTSEAGNMASKAFGDIDKTLASTVAGLASVTAAIGLVKSEFNSAVREIQRSADFAAKSQQTIMGTLAGAGQLGALPGFRNKLQGAGGKFLTQSEVETTVAQISKNMGGRISPDELLRAGQSSVAARAAGIDDITGFGTTVAQLGTVPGLKGLSGDKLNEVAFALQKIKPGGLSEQDLRFIKRGKDPLSALNVVLAGAKSSESARGLESLEEEASQDFDPVKVRELQLEKRRHPRKFTEEKERYLRLAGVPEDDRFDALLSDPSLVSPGRRRLVGNLKQNLDPQEIQKAIAGGDFASQLGTADTLRSNDPLIREAARAKRLEVQKEELDRRDPEGSLNNENFYKQSENNLRKAGLSEGTAHGLNEVNRFLSWIGMPGAKTSEKMLKELQEQTEHLEELSGSANRNGDAAGRANTALQNGSAGQR